MARADFHPLRVQRVDALTDDSAAVTFDVPPALRHTFDFAAGQWLTVRRGSDRRSYSICAPVGQPPRIGVRQVEGGSLSGWLVRQVRAGDVLEVQPPAGSFTPDLTPAGRHVLIAAGSGITPVLSIAASVLRANRDSTVTLLYGNRRSDSVMFLDEVSELKDAYPSRMRLFHILSREPQEVELFSGRLDAARLHRIVPALVDVPTVDHWWLCGPYGLVSDATSVLSECGAAPERVHRELFYVEDDAPPQATHPDAPAPAGAEVSVILDGRTSRSVIPAGVPVLDGAQRTRPDLPFACKGGVCGTCRALVVEGQVRMRRNYALEPAEVQAGYVLTCQAIPLTDHVTVDYDS